MRSSLISLTFVTALLTFAACGFADQPAHESSLQSPAREHPKERPTLPAPACTWPGATIIIIVGMFLAALVVGPVVRANMPPQAPEPHAHDDHDHGHSHGGHH